MHINALSMQHANSETTQQHNNTPTASTPVGMICGVKNFAIYERNHSATSPHID
jgi:hypothetical protein